jgi:DNA-binding transcriptional ArsR family regulator
MDPFAVLADPTRRRILELLAERELSSGEVTALVRAETGLSQPAVSQHLGVLRDGGFATVRVNGARRLYRLDRTALNAVAAWVDRLVPEFEQTLDALATEIARGKRERRTRGPDTGSLDEASAS